MNGEMNQIGRNAMKQDKSVAKNSPNWNLYRMNLSQKTHVKSQSRASYSFPRFKEDYTDYVRATFSDFDIKRFLGLGICKKVGYANIRGHQCAQCCSRLTSIAFTVAVSLFPPQVLFRAKIILVSILMATILSFAVVLAPILQPTGGLVDICTLKWHNRIACFKTSNILNRENDSIQFSERLKIPKFRNWTSIYLNFF